MLTQCFWLYEEVSPLNLFDAKYARGEKRSNARETLTLRQDICPLIV